MKKGLYILYAFIALFLAYNIWSRSGRDYTYKCIYHAQVQSFGNNIFKGNIVGIQPYFTPFDFSRASSFYEILDYHFQQAKNAGLFNYKTIVVLPEYTGTFLVVAGEKNSVFLNKEMAPAMRTIVLSNLGEFFLRYVRASSGDKKKEALFRMKARRMKNIYEKAFSELAKKYKVTIVAGSILLPGPHITDGQLRIDKKEPLYNVSCVFDPRGKVLSPLVVKQFPITEEKIFTECGQGTTPIFITPAGKLAVLVCADSWYPLMYSNLKGTDIAVVPAYVSSNGAWQQKWAGYSGTPSPQDVLPEDVGQLSEQEAWQKYALNGRAHNAGIHNGITVFLRGDLWDIGSDGSALVVSDTTARQAAPQQDHTGQIINLWLQ